MERNLAAALRLMLVTDDSLVAPGDLPSACLAAVRGGATIVQLRLKRASARELVALARELRPLLHVPLLVNDRLDVALAAGADGVHLGADDLPVAVARRMAPPGFLIGASVGAVSEADLGVGADYWGVGPWRASSTKTDAGPGIAEAGFQAIRRLVPEIPCVAIGGILPEDIPSVFRAGGVGVAVAGGILSSGAIEVAARRYSEAFPDSTGIS